MIIAVIFNLILAPINALVNLLPAGSSLGLNTLASSITSSASWPQLGWANDYVPLSTAIACITLIMTIMTTSIAIRIGIWTYNQFWGHELVSVTPKLNVMTAVEHAIPWHLLKLAGETTLATLIILGTLAAATCILALRRNPS